MTSPYDGVLVASTGSTFSTGSSEAFVRGDCPECGAHQFMVIARTSLLDKAWLRCIQCGLALATNDGVASPPQLPLRIPSGVAGAELGAWKEVRECLGVGAYSAAVMLCRKLLMHVAVSHGLPEKDGKDRAPSFAQCVDHLVSEGIVTKRMEPWIDRIREVGNEANHELVPVGQDSALDVAMFTQKLLELAYEMDDTMAKVGPPQ